MPRGSHIFLTHTDDASKNFLQTNLFSDDILSLVGNVIKEEMTRREKEKLVYERYSISDKPVYKENSKGESVAYCIAYRGEKEQVTAMTRERLIEKLIRRIEEEPKIKKDVTLEELFEMYYEERRSDKSISDQTSHYDLSNWNRFFRDSDFSKSKVVELTAFSILKEYKNIVKRGEITKKAFNKASGLLCGILDLAVEKGIVEVNVARNTPTKKLTFRPEADNSDMVYKPEERDLLVKYLKSIPQTRYTLAVRLMACLPLRMGELRALTWEDYDKDAKKLYIHHEIVKEKRDGKERCDVDVPFTKGAKDSGKRRIPVSSEAMQILEKLRDMNGDCKYILQGHGNAKFAMPENKINEHLRQYCQEAGVTYFSSHKFRFYGATQLYKAGVSLDTIRYYLGHSTIKMTEHYLRLTPEDADMNIIESVFG